MTADQMKTIRKGLGLTQTQMGRMLRLKAGARIVGAWERGERTPSGPVVIIYELLERRSTLVKELPAL